MASIDQIIKQAVNPFDPVTFYTRNFWQEPEARSPTVDSIHQNIIMEIESFLDQVASDRYPRTLLLVGDSGSGKSYLLARLKRLLNPKAFFAYIHSWPDSNYIWRHILRYTVDSLMCAPEGQQESQLLLWLRGLSAFKNSSLSKKLQGDRKQFISNFKATYPSGVYNPSEFFKVLYHLTNPELFPLACEWLRGDELDEDDLKALGVKRSIGTEDAAQKNLANLGRISAGTQPIVLCFDQLDNIPRLPDNYLDLQALFNVNTSIHNRYPSNFLVIISIVKNTWKHHGDRIQPADKVSGRINQELSLKPITLDEAEAIWASRLYPLHQQANSQPSSPIFPLTRQELEKKFPRSKTDPRNTLFLGRDLFQTYKENLVVDDNKFPSKSKQDTFSKKTPVISPKPDYLAAFQLIWIDEFQKNEQNISRIGYFSSPELIRMLQETLAALNVENIQLRLLPSKTCSSYSLSFLHPRQQVKAGIVWTEDANLTKFCSQMKSCKQAITQNLCQTLHLIRAEILGTAKNKGYKLYKQIFSNSSHPHITPDLKSVHYLATYHQLVNSTRSGELVVGDKTPDIKELKSLVRESKILEECSLLQDLGIVIGTKNGGGNGKVNYQQVNKFLLNHVQNQQFLARQTLIQNACSQFPHMERSQVEQLIQQFCQENQIQILDPNATPEEQLIALVP